MRQEAEIPIPQDRPTGALGEAATDQAGNVTKYVYNSINQVTSTTTAYGTADAATTYTSYNAQGQVATQTDADGNVTSYVYDLAGREISFSVIGNPSPVTSYTYNPAGQQASMTDANGHTTQYVYL